MSSYALKPGANIARLLAEGGLRVGPAFTTLPGISKVDDDTIAYVVGVLNEGTISARLYKDGEILLDDLTTSGTIEVTSSDAGSVLQLRSVGTNTSGNNTVELTDEYIIDTDPEVPVPVISVLENATATMTYQVIFGAILGNYQSETVTISDGVDTFDLDDDGIQVMKGEAERVLSVIRSVVAYDGSVILKTATTIIPAQTQLVVFEVGVFEPGVYY